MSPPFNALALLQALRRRWLAAVVLGVLAAGILGAAVWYFLPPAQYMASAKFRIESKPEGTLYDHPEGKTDFSNYEQMQVALLKSQMVLNAALKQPRVGQIPEVRKAIDPVAWLEKEIHIDLPNGPEILHLTISSDDKDTCKILVDGVSAAYLQEVGSGAIKHRDEKRKNLTELVDKFQTRLKNLRADIRKKAEPVGSEDNQVLALKQRMAHEQAMSAQHELVEIESRLRSLKNEQSLLPKDGDPVPTEISQRTVDALVEKRLEGTGLLSEKAQLQSQIEVMKGQAVGGENHPEVRKLVAKLDVLTKDLDARRKALQADCEAQLRDGAAAASAGRAGQLRDDIAKAEALQKRLLTDIQRLDSESREINKTALDLEDQKREIAQVEADAARSTQELGKLSVEKDDPSRVRLWEETVVTHPDETERKTKMAGMSAVGAFLAMALLVGLVEFRSKRVHTPQQLVRGLGLTLVGTVPARKSRRLAAGAPLWDSLLTESIDAARTMIVHGVQSQSIRVIMITSAVGGEGKTSLASHLAVSLARSGRRTLLIDGDLRNPAVHRLFDVLPGPGFGELLRREARALDVVRPTAVAGLEVISAGNCDQAALSLLSQRVVGDLLTELKESFDVIVLDSSPVLPVADSLQLARHVDGVLLSVMQNVSTLPNVHEARQRLTSLGVHLIGAVVSGTHPDVSSYGRQRYLTPMTAGK